MKPRVFASNGVYIAHIRPGNTYIVYYRNTSVIRFEPRDVLKVLMLSKNTPTRLELEEFLGLTASAAKQEKDVNPKTII